VISIRITTNVGFYILTAVGMNGHIFWGIPICSLLESAEISDYKLLPVSRWFPVCITLQH
jgi:hypothetical protein